MSLSKPSGSGKAPALSVSDYIQSRINSAGTFNSTKMWIKNENFEEARRLLGEGGFNYTVLQTEPKSRQLEVSW